MDMQCDKGIMRDGGGVLEYCRMKKIPVRRRGLPFSMDIFGELFLDLIIIGN
ncbi:MAG: hypothetical protein ACLTER_23895 [Ruminococcus sp.]